MITALKLSRLTRKQRWIGAAVLAGVVLAALAGVIANRRARGEAARLPLHTVRRGDLLISITEGGTLEAVKEVKVLSEIRGQVRIISIVTEGTTVKKGDLLVELDDADLRNRLSQEQISFQSALASGWSEPQPLAPLLSAAGVNHQYEICLAPAASE